jgi:hypothetical protein
MQTEVEVPGVGVVEFPDTMSPEEIQAALQTMYPPQQEALPGAGVRVENPDGTFSTERTIGVNIDGREYVIPTLVEGRQVSEDEAIQEAQRRGLQNYPSFDTVEKAEEYARQRSEQLGAVEADAPLPPYPPPQEASVLGKLAGMTPLGMYAKGISQVAKVFQTPEVAPGSVSDNLVRALEQERKSPTPGWDQYISERLPLTGALSSAQKNVDVLSAAARIKQQQGSEDDYRVLARYIAEGEREGEKGWWRRVADVATMIPGYGIEFALTGGAYTAGRKLATKAAGTAAKSVTRKVAEGIATRAVGVAAQTAANPQRIVEETSNQLLKNLNITKDQAGQLSVILQDDVGFAEALTKGVLGTAIELGSERAGGMLARGAGALWNKLPFASKAAALRAAVVSRYLGQPGATVEKLQDLLNKAGWHGVIGESLEERVGEVGRGVAGVSEDYGTTGDIAAGRLRDAAYQLTVEAAAFAIPGLAQQIGGRSVDRLKTLKAIRAAEGSQLKRRAAEVGVTGTRSEVRKKLDAKIQQAEQEIQDALQERKAEEVPARETPRGGKAVGPKVRGKGGEAKAEEVQVTYSDPNKQMAYEQGLESEAEEVNPYHELDSRRAPWDRGHGKTHGERAAPEAPPVSEPTPQPEVAPETPTEAPTQPPAAPEAAPQPEVATVDKWGRKIPKETVEERRDFLRKATPGATFKHSNYSGSEFRVEPDGRLFEMTSNRYMGTVADMAKHLGSNKDWGSGKIIWTQAPTPAPPTKAVPQSPTQPPVALEAAPPIEPTAAKRSAGGPVEAVGAQEAESPGKEGVLAPDTDWDTVKAEAKKLGIPIKGGKAKLIQEINSKRAAQPTPKAAPKETAAEEAQRRAEEARPTGRAYGAGPGGGEISLERIRSEGIGKVMEAPPEQEAALQKARGLRKPVFRDRIRAAMEKVKRLGRSIEHIPKIGEFGSVHETFRLLKNARNQGVDEAMRTAFAVTDELKDADDLNLFERYAVISNLAAAVRGEVPQPLRFRFESPEQVEQYLERLEKMVELVPAVKRAVETRRNIVKEAAQQLVDLKLLPKAALDNVDTYYHQQVHFYAMAGSPRPGGGRFDTKKGYRKRRVVGRDLNIEDMDYNTAYHEAEISWLADAYTDIETHTRFREMMDNEDVKPQLKDQAKRQNFENVVGGPDVAARIDQIRGEIAESWESEDRQDSAERQRRRALIEELEEIDPTYPYRTQIAKMADWFRKEHGLDEEGLADWYGDDGADAMFWELVHEEADKGNVPALAFFKALNARETFIQDTLGDQYLTWQSLANEMPDRRLAQITPGNVFYRAFTLPDQVVEQLLENVIETAEVSQDDLRQVFAMGGPREQFVVRNEVADQIESMRKADRVTGISGFIDEVFREAIRAFKVWALLGPKRALSYMLRNVTGDIEPVVAADPTLLKHWKKSLGMLRNYHSERLHLPEPVRVARDHSVIGSGFATEEVPDIKEMEIMRRFAPEAKGAFRLIKGYWRTVRKYNQWREDSLRLAAFMGYRAQLRQGRVKHYGGAKKAVVQQIKRDMGVDAAAAHLARNLIGDYGDISIAGQWLREHLMPFWSFQEINMKRVPRLAINAYDAGANLRAAGALSVGAARVILTSRIAWMLGGLWVWNHLAQGGDEEEELTGRDRATPHIILGRNPDGSIRVFRRVGALGDFLEWFGIPEAMALAGMWKEGQVTTGEAGKEMVAAPFEKVIHSLRPDLKALYEVPTEQSLFPEPFDPRSVRRGEAVMGIGGLQDEYNWMRGWVLGDGSTARPHYWKRYMVGVVDPRHASLSQAYEWRRRFLKTKGREEKGVFPISKYKQARDAAKFEDYDAFVDWKRQFVKERGDKAKGDFKDWLGTLDPIANKLNDAYELEFETKFLTGEQRKRMRVARSYAGELRDLLVTWWDADERSKPMRKAVVFSAFRRMDTSEPQRTKYASNKSGDEEYRAAKAKFTLDNAKAARDIKAMTSSLSEAEKLLLNLYNTLDKSGKRMISADAYYLKLAALRKLWTEK